jgi:hypothetical protein
MAQEVEHLPSKHETLSLNSSKTKKKKKKLINTARKVFPNVNVQAGVNFKNS